MTNIIKQCRGEKKRGIRIIDGFKKKLMIPVYEISVSIEYVVKSKIKTIFVNEKILEEYSVKIYEIDPYFYEHYKKKNSLAVEIDEKGHTDTDLIFEEKRQKALVKKLNCTFIRINTSKENYDVDYEASKIQTFISNFKDKEKENEIKKLEDEINKLKLQLTNLNVKNNDDNVNDNDKIIIIIIIIIQSHYKKCIFIAKIVINIQVTHFQKN